MGRAERVEIRAAKIDGWFFHAITAEEWLLKMKFRTARNTFRREDLVARLDLKPLNDMPDLPLYGTEPPSRCGTCVGPGRRSYELRVHTYQRSTARSSGTSSIGRSPGSGRSPIGHGSGPKTCTLEGPRPEVAPGAARLPRGQEVRWEVNVLERSWKSSSKPRTGSSSWSNKQVVPVYVPGQKEPWAAIQTKTTGSISRSSGPRDVFPWAEVTGLGFGPEVDAQRSEVDYIRLKFRSPEDLERGELPAFLKEHLDSLSRGA